MIPSVDGDGERGVRMLLFVRERLGRVRVRVKEWLPSVSTSIHPKGEKEEEKNKKGEYSDGGGRNLQEAGGGTYCGNDGCDG